MEKINLVSLLDEYGIEDGANHMKEICIIGYGFKPSNISVCNYTKNCSYCWREVLEEVNFRNKRRNI